MEVAQRKPADAREIPAARNENIDQTAEAVTQSSGRRPSAGRRRSSSCRLVIVSEG